MLSIRIRWRCPDEYVLKSVGVFAVIVLFSLKYLPSLSCFRLLVSFLSFVKAHNKNSGQTVSGGATLWIGKRFEVMSELSIACCCLPLTSGPSTTYHVVHTIVTNAPKPGQLGRITLVSVEIFYGFIGDFHSTICGVSCQSCVFSKRIYRLLFFFKN